MKEEDIRPNDIFGEYLRLAKADALEFFSESKRRKISCPACGFEGIYVFSKHGFEYDECKTCNTIFVSPRPDAKSFFRYYKDSASARYFGTVFYKHTQDARRRLLWKPKARQIFRALEKCGAATYKVIDIGGGNGIFAEEYYKIAKSPVTIIEPGPESAKVCRAKGLIVLEKFLESVKNDDLPSGKRAFVSFELFEHLHDPRFFLGHLRSLMRPGDYFIFTTLSGMGLDIQLLWNNSNSFSLQHLNFFNPKSIKLLVEAMGFKLIEVNTPGKIDMDILYKNRNLITDRFMRNLLSNATPLQLSMWQSFIRKQLISSHMFVMCESL